MLETVYTELNNLIVFQVKIMTASIALFLWGAISTPLSIKLAGRFGLIDLPEPRKIHSSPVPRGAGLIIWVGYLFWSLVFAPTDPFLTLVATGATMVFFVGYMDDMMSLSPFVRLIIQIIASLIVAVPSWNSSPFISFIMVIWLAGSTNAYNLIDGLNGLALSMAIIVFMCLAFGGDVFFALPIACLCLGVLRWNFPRALTFLGDGGVYMLGFLVASFTGQWVISTFGDLGIIKLVISLILLGGVPVIETLSTIIRRLLRGKSPFLPDRGHFHHRLLDYGLSPVKTLVVLSFLHVFFIFLGIHFILH